MIGVVRQHLVIDVADGRPGVALAVPENRVYRRQLHEATLELAVHDPAEGAVERFPVAIDAPQLETGTDTVRWQTATLVVAVADARAAGDAGPLSSRGSIDG